MNPALSDRLKKVSWLLQMRAPDPPEFIRRVIIMERDVILPLKGAGIAMLLYSFYFSPWFGRVLGALEIAIEQTQYFFWVYVSLNVLFGLVLLRVRTAPLALVEWSVFAIGLIDGIFLGALILVTGGYDSVLYWLFLGLIVRTAVSVPSAASQLMLNLTLTCCYVLAGVVDIKLYSYLDPDTRESLRLSGGANNPTEPLVVRLVLLLVMTGFSYGVQVLIERQRKAEEEAREFAMREGQLHAAGRLAAEFAHQMKNPLAIINTATFSLQRAMRGAKPEVLEKVQMIQEEVDHADRIITQIMGYAQLSEGRVEKVNPLEELDLAIQRVFPPAAGFPIQVRKDYGTDIPILVMQRRHLFETFLNVLQNAREALEDLPGGVFVSARLTENYAVEVVIRDEGPGIPPDKLARIFEPYYTTKAKGTGIGLATVKHNVELYGGTVRVESELGRGATFVLTFPARVQKPGV
jgi:signal transduction histidine kinase